MIEWYIGRLITGGQSSGLSFLPDWHLVVGSVNPLTAATFSIVHWSRHVQILFGVRSRRPALNRERRPDTGVLSAQYQRPRP